MSEEKNNPLPPPSPMPPSDDTTKNSPVLTKDKVAVHASQITQKTNSNISPVPNRPNIKAMLTPAPGRLTPTGQGRIKVPVCVAPALKRAASTIDDFNMDGVCFSPEEAENCAEKAIVLGGNDGNGNNDMDDTPLNVEKCEPGFPAASGRAFASSSSTVITTSSASSCGRSAMGNEIAVAAARAVKTDPPLKVVRTDLDAGSGDDRLEGGAGVANATEPKSALPSRGSSNALSANFTDNLIKGNASRQGRSLQRWLVHSPTDELVRQVAGTIPITRDGRIILVSASRKTEWILPKGGWDEDETKEECAARETFEEGGLLGRLGGCLVPIDYETRKSKKRKLSQEAGGGKGKVGLGASAGEGGGNAKAGKREQCDGSRPPLPKRAKSGKEGQTSPTGPDLAFSSTSKGGPTSQQAVTATATTSLDPKNYSYVRMFLFPLYVSTVKSDWPEKGRLRKLVDIDEAIKIMEAENRLYFKRGLEMIKERGLHLLKPDGPE